MAQAAGSTEDDRLREALVEGRLLNDVQVRVVLDYQRSVGGSLRDVVLRLGFLSEEQLKGAVMGAERVSVTTSMVADSLAMKAPFRLLRGYRVVPIRLDDKVVLAAEDAELEPIVREELWGLLGTHLPVVQAEPGTIIASLDVLEQAQKVEESSVGGLPDISLQDLVAMLVKRGVISMEDLLAVSESDRAKVLSS